MTLRNHLDESALAQVLDDQYDDRDQQKYQAHLDECGRCRELLHGLRTEATSLSDLLTEADVDVPRIPLAVRLPRVRRSFVLRYAAAAVVGGILFAFTITPVRAWVLENMIGPSVRLFGAAPTEETAVIDTLESVPTNRVTVSIPVDRDVLQIRLANRQQQGTLVIARVNGATASAEIMNGATERLVLGDGLVIQNDAMSVASYVVYVPANFSVEVVVADEPVERIVFGESVTQREIDLGPR